MCVYMVDGMESAEQSRIDVILRPGALCCPEIYRDVPGMLIMMMMMMMMMSLTGVGELNPY